MEVEGFLQELKYSDGGIEGRRRCTASPDIITGYEARRRLLMRNEHDANAKREAEIQENFRNLQRRRARIERSRITAKSVRRTLLSGRAVFEGLQSRRGILVSWVREDSEDTTDSESYRRGPRGNAGSPDICVGAEVAPDLDHFGPPILSRQRPRSPDTRNLDQAALDAIQETRRQIIIAANDGTIESSDTSEEEEEESDDSAATLFRFLAQGDSLARAIVPVQPPALPTNRGMASAAPEDLVSSSSKMSTDDSSSDDESSRKRSRKTKKEHKKLKKSKKKLLKRLHKEERRAKKKSKKAKRESSVTYASFMATREKPGESSAGRAQNGSTEEESQNVGSTSDIVRMRNKMKPMTKEEWDKQQSQVRREASPTTGRMRLIKGTGEVIEEIVSRDRQKAINRMATIGDGRAFQASLQKKLKK